MRAPIGRYGAQPRLAIRDVLAEAVRDPAAVAAALPPTRAEIVRVHLTPQLTILKVVWAPGMTLGPHDHRIWAAIGVYSGGEDNSFYRRPTTSNTSSTTSKRPTARTPHPDRAARTELPIGTALRKCLIAAVRLHFFERKQDDLHASDRGAFRRLWQRFCRSRPRRCIKRWAAHGGAGATKDVRQTERVVRSDSPRRDWGPRNMASARRQHPARPAAGTFARGAGHRDERRVGAHRLLQRLVGVGGRASAGAHRRIGPTWWSAGRCGGRPNT